MDGYLVNVIIVINLLVLWDRARGNQAYSIISTSILF